jgi:hypothetical protein
VIDIGNYSKAQVLAALFNASKQQGMGFMHTEGQKDITVEEAELIIAAEPCMYFDYVRGRVMKVDLQGDAFHPELYNRDNGPGAAERAIASI